MKLINLTDSQGPKGQSRRYGMFECPVCLKHVEKALTHGKRNKTCGDKECRKAAFTANPNQLKTQYSGRIHTLPLYSSINGFYGRVKANTNIVFDKSVDTLNKFIEATYEEYTKIREENRNIPLTVIGADGSNKVTDTSFKFVKIEDAEVTIDTLNELTRYNSVSLANDVGARHARIQATLKRTLDRQLKQIEVSTNYHTSVLASELTMEEYEEFKIYFKFHKKIDTKSNTLYVIRQSNTDSYKIGITHNINKRFKTLQASNPYNIELVMTCEYEDAGAVERYLHGKLKLDQIHYEWFTLTIPQVDWIKKYSDTLPTMVHEQQTHRQQLKEARSKSDTVEAHEAGKAKYTKMLADRREANEKPTVEVVVDEDRKEYINDRSAQIEACTKHGLAGTDVYRIWQNAKRVFRDDIEDAWLDPAIFARDVKRKVDAITEQATIQKVNKDEKLGRHNHKIVKTTEAQYASGVAKEIVQLDKKTGEELARFASAAEAARSLGVKGSHINSVCNGKRKTAEGYKWKFAEE